MGAATQDLRNEHDAILYVLQILDKMILSSLKEPESALRHYGEVVYFLKIFADKCHHGKEENYLFEELVAKGMSVEGGPIGVMLAEHTEGREYIAEMSQGYDEKDVERFNKAATLYRDLLRQHIEKENGVLFVMADNMLDEQAQSKMFKQFELFEEEVIGQGVHDKLHAMIDEWAAAYDVG